MSSNNTIYISIPEVLQSCTTLEAQLAMIDVILMNMLTTLTAASLSGNFSEYKLDTGQTKSEITYRSVGELTAAWEKMFDVRRKVLALLNITRQGRGLRLIPNKNFIGRSNFNF